MDGLRSGEEKACVISFVGKAKPADSGGRRYRKTLYRFGDGSVHEATFFGCALIDHLKGQVGKAVFVGTYGSTWSELIELLPDQEQEDLLPLVDEIDTLGDRLTEEKLGEFERALEERLPYDLAFVCVSNSPDNVYEVKDKLLPRLIPIPGRIVFDITHSYRYLPYVALLSLVPLKYMGVRDIEVYYGAYEFRGGKESPVIKLDILSNLINLTEAMSVFQNTGDFSRLGSMLFPEKKDIFLKAAFKIEINQRPTQEISEIQKLKPESLYAEPIIEEVRKIGEERHLEDRFIRRAEFFLARRQYLKAILLINEALLIRLNSLEGRSNKVGYKDWKDFDLESLLDEHEDVEKLEVFRRLRNVVVHSSEPEGMYAGRIKNMTMDEKSLRDFLEEVISIYRKLSCRR